MNSGNTYRMRPDGSHAEYFTHGQVNPFGLAFDPLGNLYSCDCHSRPVYQLLRGAWYPSFGKPHDGLGFGPEMVTHDHGSTGIAGISLLRGRPVPGGVSRHDLHRQRGHQPHQPRPDRVARLDAQGDRAARLRLERGQLVPAGRHRARPRRGALRRRLLQPDHRPLRGAADPPRPRPRAGGSGGSSTAARTGKLPPPPRRVDRTKSSVESADHRPWPPQPDRPDHGRQPARRARRRRTRSAICAGRCRPAPRPAAGSTRCGSCTGSASSTRRRSWPARRSAPTASSACTGSRCSSSGLS